MSIQIMNKTKEVVAKGDTLAVGEIPTERKEIMMVYVIYEKGSEDGITISYEVRDTKMNDFFPVLQDAGTLTAYSNNITATGKYRIVIPTAINEDLLKVTVQMYGADLTTVGNVSVICVPDKHWT